MPANSRKRANQKQQAKASGSRQEAPANTRKRANQKQHAQASSSRQQALATPAAAGSNRTGKVAPTKAAAGAAKVQAKHQQASSKQQQPEAIVRPAATTTANQ